MQDIPMKCIVLEYHTKHVFFNRSLNGKEILENYFKSSIAFASTLSCF